MTESIADRLAAEIKRANARMEDAVAVARAWEHYRDSLANTAREYNEWAASRPPLPALPGLPQADALTAPGVADVRAQVAPHLPGSSSWASNEPYVEPPTPGSVLHVDRREPDPTGLHRTVPDGSGAPQTVPDGEATS